MIFTATDIITGAFRRLNRLSPGEALNADDASFGLAMLNELVDELNAQNDFLYQNILTSGTASSSTITLGSGSWASINPGDQIVSATADNLEMSPISMAQYNTIYQPSVTGRPTVWSSDGLNTVYLWPVPTGNTIKIQTRSAMSAFADLTTSYTTPDGWKAALAAGLAVRMAPTMIGGATPDLIRAEKQTMGAVARYEPAILNSETYNKPRQYFPPRLF